MIRPISFTVFVITALSSVADPVVLQSPPAIRVAESQVLAVRPGDFDRDGRPDVLVAHYRDQIEVLLSRGAGTYERVSTLVPDLDALPTVAEITGDGTLDFAYWPAGSVSTIVVYAGDGSGAFKPWSRLDTLREPEAVAVADFDRDGNADFIVSGEDAGSNYQTAIHFGRATGTFGAAATVTSHRPSELVATDLTNDAIVDVVDTGGVLIGRGDGTFERRWMYEMRMITVGDFNRDGWKDLASLGHDPYVSVALGTGGGHFAPRVKYLVGDVLAMALADVDEDGIEDIVTSGGYLAVLRGIGDGRFAPAERYVSPRGKEIVCGDFDWDGDVDAITDSSFFSYIPGLSFLAGTGAGSFDAYRSFLVHIDPSASQIGLASGPVADMNGDGYPDVIFLFGRYEPAGYLWYLI